MLSYFSRVLDWEHTSGRFMLPQTEPTGVILQGEGANWNGTTCGDREVTRATATRRSVVVPVSTDSTRSLLKPTYTIRLCRIRQAYDLPTTWIVSCKSNLQLAFDCRVGPKSCRRPVLSLLYATKSYRVNRPLARSYRVKTILQTHDSFKTVNICLTVFF